MNNNVARTIVIAVAVVVIPINVVREAHNAGAVAKLTGQL